MFNAGNCAAKPQQWITKAYGKGKIGASMCGKYSVKLRKYFETKGKELLERLQNLKTDELAEYLKKDTKHRTREPTESLQKSTRLKDALESKRLLFEPINPSSQM